jgi:hypothetical protein
MFGVLTECAEALMEKLKKVHDERESAWSGEDVRAVLTGLSRVWYPRIRRLADVAGFRYLETD